MYILYYVDPCDVFLRPLFNGLLIVHTNHVSDNDVSLGSATASTNLGGWTNPVQANYFEDYARVPYTKLGDWVFFVV